MSEIEIRAARPEDASALEDVFEAAYAPYRDLSGLPDVTGGIADDIEHRMVWVAADPVGVLGGIVMTIEAPIAHIVNLGVHTDGAGRGLGRLLVETALDAARRSGAACARLVTHKDMKGTRTFYSKLGWTEVEVSDVKVVLERML